MRMKKLSIKNLFIAIFGGFFMLLNVFATPNTALAEGESTPETQQTQQTQENTKKETKKTKNACEDELGQISWRLCPETEKASEGADWIYEKIEEILVLNPVAAKDGEPVYEIWKYCRDIANVVFIIFLLVVTFSQITGVGINNYGIKKALPKIVIAAILVNLSFIICSLAVDVSNIVGTNIRGLFASIESSIAGEQSVHELSATYAEYYKAITGAGGITIAGLLIAIESGTIWMLIPTVLASLISVAIGLITVAMRQALVVLLVMVSPLALVAYILPNTEDLFKKWKKLFIKMLVFFPIMGLLFGASNLAGWAIIRGASNGFMILLGKAVQFFPLFLSFKLMKMSDTILGTISGKLTNMTRPLIASNTAWAESHRALRKSEMLKNDPYTPYARLSQFLSKHRIAREADTADNQNTVKLKGLAYRARRKYDGKGGLTKIGKEEYAQQARDMRLNEVLENDKNNFNEGFSSHFDKNDPEYEELLKLDLENVNAADALFDESARAATIDQHNAKGRYKRYKDAINAHMDEEYGGREHGYRYHNIRDREAAIERYNTIMSKFKDTNIDKNLSDVQYVVAESASAYNAQAQVRQGKFQKLYNMTVPTQDVVHLVDELASRSDSSENIDSIIAGMRVLNERGDTDLVEDAIYKICENNKLKLGTYASQALASFAMFEVKGNSPVIRRFGKYINLETAKMFNNLKEGEEEIEIRADGTRKYNRRPKESIDFNEYILGGYQLENGDMVYPKRGASTLLNGTDFKTVERLAFDDINKAIERACSYKENGVDKLDMRKYTEKQKEIWNAILPNVVSDQFGYLSGGEPVIAWAQFVSGVRPKEENGQIVRNDRGGIIYDDTLDDKFLDKYGASEEDRRMFYDFRKDRMNSFWDAQVSNQVSKTKTDVLGAELAAYKKLVRNDNPNATEEEQKRAAYQEIRDSIRPDIKKTLAKSYRKGWQGDTKTGLIDALGLNDDHVIEEYLGYNTSGNRDDGTPPPPTQDTEDQAPSPDHTDEFINIFLNNLRMANNDRNPAEAPATIEQVYETILNAMDNPRYGLNAEQKQSIRELHEILRGYATVQELIDDVIAIYYNDGE